MENIKALLRDILENPDMLKSAFSSPLTMKEELQIRAYDLALEAKTNSILKLALAGSTEIMMKSEERNGIMEMLRIRRLLQGVLRDRGSFAQGFEGLN